MGLLTQEERKELIGILLKLPSHDNPVARRQLYWGLPRELQDQIGDDPAPRIHFTSIVNTVDDEAWHEPPYEGKWPVMELIKNAIFQAGNGSPVGRELLSLLNKFEVRLGLPITIITKPKPKPVLLSHFTKKLDDLINRIPTLQTELQDISNSFNNRIYPRDCINEHARLKQACLSVCDFSAHLIQSA